MFESMCCDMFDFELYDGLCVCDYVLVLCLEMVVIGLYELGVVDIDVNELY